jgi:hypothetical protein
MTGLRRVYRMFDWGVVGEVVLAVLGMGGLVWSVWTVCGG